MNDLPRQKLRELIIEYGRALCDDPRRCEALLKDYCGEYKREIAVLVSAAKEKVPQQLISASVGVPPSILKARLIKRLYENLGIAENFAEWAVESWSMALFDSETDINIQATHTKNQEEKRNLELANSTGDATAQFNLGWMYQEGRGVPQDDQEAVKWYRLAAEQGDATAQGNLGWMYVTGRGVQQDDQEAVKWYRLAAEQGHATAQFNLGWMYQEGRGVQQDDQEAVKWWGLAAEQGDATAQFNLGLMYQEGRGVQQDDQAIID